MDLNNKLADSQREILDDIIAREIQISELYDQFAAAFHEHFTLWTELANDERMHAEILEGMRVYVDQGIPLWHLGKLKKSNIIEQEQNVLKQVEHKLQMGKLGSNDALMTAMRLESSVIDAQFFDTVYIDHPEFAAVSERVQKEESEHMNKIKRALLANV